MKTFANPFLCVILLSVLMVSTSSVSGQAYRKGSFTISLSEGSTTANYTTVGPGSAGSPDTKTKTRMKGVRDPLILEYCLTKHIGIGLSVGGDIFKVNPSQYYGFALPSGNKVQMTTSDVNFDLNYHFYSNKRFDFSAFSSVGTFRVGTSGIEKLPADDDNLSNDFYAYSYNSKGRIVRTGTKAKVYIGRRWGLMTMLSVYSGKASTKGIKDNTVGANYSTKITGFASEFGLCFRFF